MKKSQQQHSSSVNANMEKWLTIVSVSFISLVAFETLAVATAMPFVVEILHGEHLYALAAGITLATQLTTTALAGKWCDAKGPRQCLMAGLSLFAAGLIIATAAPTIEVLVLGRAVQGFGGGLIIVPLYVFVGNYIHPSRQPRVFASFAAAWVLPSLIGPFIAGLFVDHLHWRLVFGFVPACLILVIPILARLLRRFPPLHDPLPFTGLTRILTLACGTGVCIAALQIISGIKTTTFSYLLIGAIIALSVLAFICVRPLLPRGTLLAQPGLGASVAMRGILNGTYIAVEVYLPLMLKNLHGWNPTQAGLIMTTGAVTWALGSWVQGRITSPELRRQLPILGPILQLFGTLLTLCAASPSLPGILAVFGWLIAGFGTGLIYPALTVHALALTELSEHGIVSSAISIMDSMGAALFVAYAGIIFAILASWGLWAYASVIISMSIILVAALWVGLRVDMGRTSSPSQIQSEK
ncbi:MFS transporter [Trueperella sp. LYQ143]|uniref:MFS transporter n=1 Tax=unclassified Trueperella TaxID=2630174 RepID=UPI00398399F6